MSTRSPFGVRLASASMEQHIDPRDLSFTKTARGGYTEATFTLPEWVNTSSDILDPLSRLTIDDAATARTLWQGYLDIPGKSVDEQGHTWKVGALGAASMLGDRTQPYIVIDTRLDAWHKRDVSSPSATAEMSSLPSNEGIPALLCQFPPGQPIGNGSLAAIRWDELRGVAQQLAAFKYTYICGINSDPGFLTARARVVGGGGGGYTVHNTNFSATPFTPNTAIARRDSGGFDSEHKTLTLAAYRNTGGATTVTTDDRWCAFYDLWLRTKLLGLDGRDIGIDDFTLYDRGYVSAREVVTDALNRFTTMIDIPGADIATGYQYQIDQLAYPDGTRLPEILDDLALLEPDLTWKVGAAGPSGKHSFQMGRWPTDVRYECDSSDGWDSPGSEATLANAIRVYWTDRRGDQRSNEYPIPNVTALTQWGRTRDAEPVDLGTQVGSQAAADRVGQALAAQAATIPDAGTLTRQGPVRDHYTGCSVQPWEVEPGYLIDVADVDVPPQRLTEMTWSDSANAATFTLGTPVYSTEELVNRLTRNRRSRGRDQ